MIPERLLLDVAVQKRSSIVIASGTAPTSVALGTTYKTPIKISVESSGVVSNLTVNIVGSVNETITITPAESGYERSINTFTSITTISVSGGGGGSYTVKAVTENGNVPVETEYTVATIKGRIEISRRVIPQLDVEAQGTVHVERYTFFTNSTLQINDKLVIDGSTYLVESIPFYRNSTGYHHTEARIKLL